MFGRRTEKRKLSRIVGVLHETSRRTGIPRYADIAKGLEHMMTLGQFELDEETARDIVVALDLYSVCRTPGTPESSDVVALSNEYGKIFLKTYKVPVYQD